MLSGGKWKLGAGCWMTDVVGFGISGFMFGYGGLPKEVQSVQGAYLLQ